MAEKLAIANWVEQRYTTPANTAGFARTKNSCSSWKSLHSGHLVFFNSGLRKGWWWRLISRWAWNGFFRPECGKKEGYLQAALPDQGWLTGRQLSRRERSG